MVIVDNISLAKYNSFGISVCADRMLEFENARQLEEYFSKYSSEKYPWYPFSGGNNILLTGNYKGTLIHPVSKRIEIIDSDDKYIYVKAEAGVEWDDFVAWSVDRGLGGVENLSLIPGYVGAAPIQNIGAYGVEAKDTIVNVEAYMVDSNNVVNMSAEKCRFGYRDSIFKHELRNRAIILSVTFRLLREPQFKLGYGDLQKEVAARDGLTLRNVRDAVMAIRRRKLPDPKVLGNAGSFFKNPVVEESCMKRLLEKYPDMPHYPAAEGYAKLAAGWLIDKAGWKGFRKNNVGVHEKQALVLVNYGGATGKEILEFAGEIKESIREKFGVSIEMEVNIL